MICACIFVPDFPVEALLRAEPGLRSQPLAVLEGKPPLQKVLAVNEEARRAGVEPGMPRLQVETCTEVALRVRSAVQEQGAHAALLDCAQSFSPRVEDAACDTILLDLDGLESLFGPLSKIVRDLARRASDLGLEVNVAVASNPDAAVLAARGFSGITLIPPGKEDEQLGSLPLDVLCGSLAGFGIEEDGEKFIDIFERWGVRNLRTLAALPEVAIGERLGQAGIHLQKLARGAASRTLVPVDLPLVFEEAVELEHPLVLLEPLAFLLGRLLDQLCARLGARALATQELRLHLDLTDGHCDGIEFDGAETTAGISAHAARSTFERTLCLPVPLLDAKVFLKLLQLDLKGHPPGAPIAGIRLAAEPVRPRAAQAGLFLPPSPEPEKLELTLARIAGIVGHDRSGSLAILDTHQPEGFQMQRFAPSPPRESNPATKEDASTCSPDLVTALRMFRPAVRAAVTMRDGKPARISCPKNDAIEGTILWAAGPWRSSGDWWERGGWSRDEWDIALQGKSGIALYRLVRDLLSGHWLVEGSYD